MDDVAYAAQMADPSRRACIEDVHQLAVGMPHVTVGHGSVANPVYQVGGKSFVFFRNPRPDATDPGTAERYPDVIVFSGAVRVRQAGDGPRRELAVLHDAALCRASVGFGPGEPAPRTDLAGTGRGGAGRLALPRLVAPGSSLAQRRRALAPRAAIAVSLPPGCRATDFRAEHRDQGEQQRPDDHDCAVELCEEQDDHVADRRDGHHGGEIAASAEIGHGAPF